MRNAIIAAAIDGKEVVDLCAVCEPYSFDIILMNLRIPTIDRLVGKEIHILAMIADAFDIDFAATKASDMNAHLTKPAVAETLFQVVGQYMVNVS